MQLPKHLQNRIVAIVVLTIHPDNAQHMGRSMQSVARQTISEVCRNKGGTAVHNIEQESNSNQEEVKLTW